MSGDDSESDDWFESALDEEDSDGEPTDAPDEGDETVTDGAQSEGPFDEDAGGPFDASGAAGSGDADDEGPFDEDTDSPFDGNGSGESGDAGAESPFGGEAADPGGGDAGPFGEGGGFGDSAGGTDDEDGLFEDDFASAFESSGEGGEFDDEEFESSIPRIDLGIEGLDEMIQGGVPERHLIVTIGSAGTGKTTFGLQFLRHGLEQGESAVFITLEQSREAIVDTANERGWEFDRYEREDMLAVVDLDPVEMANSLDNIRGELPELIRDFDADRLVLDSVSLLEMMYEDQSRRRTEVFDFTRSLKQAGVTTFLTSEASESNPYASRHGIIEYLTDAVIILQYVRAENRETRLAVEIQKIRNANHSREKKPYDITLDGISVYQQANIF